MKDRKRFTEDFMVHFEAEAPNISISFRVYEVVDSEYLGGPKEGKKIVSYMLDGGEDMVDGDEIDDDALPKAMMQGSVCWSGIWEGRLYFDQEEYWGEDLKALSDLFSTHIEPWCKNYIRQFYPHADE